MFFVCKKVVNKKYMYDNQNTEISVLVLLSVQGDRCSLPKSLGWPFANL